jgi:hypothetical protein
MEGRKRAYKKERCVQVPDIFGDKVEVMLVSDFLVDSPEVCGRICLDLGRFQACGYLLQPKAGLR